MKRGKIWAMVGVVVMIGGALVIAQTGDDQAKPDGDAVLAKMMADVERSRSAMPEKPVVPEGTPIIPIGNKAPAKPSEVHPGKFSEQEWAELRKWGDDSLTKEQRAELAKQLRPIMSK